MSALAVATFAFSALIACVVGVRLLLVALRTRELPELCIGLVMIFELVSAASWAWGSGTSLGQLVSTVAGAGSATCLALFVAYTFAPGSALARLGAVALLLLAGAGLLLPTLGGGWGATDFYLRFGWVTSLARTLAYGWAAMAAGRQRASLRRRARLGLCHPLTASRVGFWSFSAGFACVSYAMPLVEIVTDTVRPSGISPVSMALAIGASVFVWLAFYPPHVYVAWALRRVDPA